MILRVGLVINPVAGVGGPLALKGSDGDALVKKALAQGAQCQANQRAKVMLAQLKDKSETIEWFAAPGVMGEDALRDSGFQAQIVGELSGQATSAGDTIRLARELVSRSIDLLLFVGGDGTARNIYDAIGYDAIGRHPLVLGIPAGVKMHSGVFAISPQAAARILLELIQEKPVSIALQEVRDIDEALLREGRVNAKYYGELRVPNDERYVQQVKNSGEQNDAMMQAEIAAGIIDDMDHETLYIIGAGTTPQAIMDELHLPNTLLGVDVVLGRELLASDVDRSALLNIMDQYPYQGIKLVITATGGQGYIIGRGNQQLGAAILEKIGKDNLLVLITPDKLSALNGRPLLMDSGDIVLDQTWSGWMPITTGYRQQSIYPLSCGNA